MVPLNDQEKYYTLKELVELLPGKPHPTTVWRWAAVGLNGVVLKKTKIGVRVLFASRDVQAFLAALNEPTAQPAAQAERSDAIERADRALAAAGL